MATVVCPDCRQTIPLGDVNVAKDVALCRRCSMTHAFSELLLEKESQELMESAHRPSGVWERTSARGVIFGASHRSIGGTLGWLAVALFWNGIVAVFVLLNLASTLHLLGIGLPEWFPVALADNDSMGWGFTLFLWLFLTPFIAIGATLIGSVFMCLGGRTEVRLEPEQGSVFTGVGPFGRRHRFNPRDVKRLRLLDQRWTDSDGDPQRRQEIVLEKIGGPPIKFGASLQPARRLYLAALLRKTLG
ncbi:hypothetical protein [Actomonas aquatica]|uniref:Zinc finger/thioredoxin putative domain-containing protein n=1 Tax=Actomonas aquatica TaxID=2866162 RepID=A0ABZ1C2N7_9BACT|nr:hypothetical protein [Opitutus sp. WL0086]WRQ85612.1 hypothetical protein K1X11_012440 [Opitutus sp. WL0086]